MKQAATGKALSSFFQNIRFFTSHMLAGQENNPAPNEASPAFNNAPHENNKVSLVTSIEENYYAVLSAQKEIISTLNLIRSETAELGNEIRRENMLKGVTLLCRLWSMMMHTDDESSQYYASLLYDSLITLGVEPIVPHAGDQYDPAVHIKADAHVSGNYIEGCSDGDNGWRMDHIIIQKAIVRIREGT